MSDFELAGNIFIQLGFEPKAPGHSHWYYPDLDLVIEIPDSTLVGSEEKISEVSIKDERLYVIGIEDLILDRLRAGVAWNSNSDMELAKYLLNAYIDDGFDIDYLKATASDSKAENNVIKNLETLLDELKRN